MAVYTTNTSAFFWFGQINDQNTRNLQNQMIILNKT